MGRAPKSLAVWLAVSLLAYLFLPWYVIEEGILDPEWMPYYPVDAEAGPALVQVFVFGRPWLLGLLPFLLLPWLAVRRPRSDPWYSSLLVLGGAGGLAFALVQGVAIGPLGPTFDAVTAVGVPEGARQYGMGAGGLIVCLGLLFTLTEGLAARGLVRGDGFVVGALGLVMASVAVFVFYPVAVILLRAFEQADGSASLAVLADNLCASSLWGLPPWSGRLGVAWRSLVLAVLAGAGSTALGLCFALVVTRTRFRYTRLLRGLTVLPIITPPFVIGLAIILVFGRAGAVTTFVADLMGVTPSRYVFGVPGILLAQLLSFTPIAFLVLIGVVEGISPSLEEAAATLRADRWRTFASISLPLMRPGLANAFLLGFIESLADFGNPLVLGGGDAVLATEIYFAVAGAQNDVPRAAALALVLLAFTTFAFVLQRRWVGNKSYTTMTGKADAGAPAPLPRALDVAVRAIALPWAAFTLAMYAMIVFGGFVKLWGHDHTLTSAHFEDLFAVSDGVATGGAWDSLLTTIEVAAISAPLTALFGLLTAYLLARQRFRGRDLFELGTMLSFAIPGTVVGVSYILAFNLPPIELTGTGAILVICFVFRNMPVGIRAGLATLSQIDPSLDEASLTLGASSATTVRRVILPLLKPAVVAALVYGFVRAMTAVSAVIFLVSADYNLATTYILGRVENGDYGPAIAYSAVLIVLMVLVIGLIEVGVGQRKVGRRGAA